MLPDAGEHAMERVPHLDRSETTLPRFRESREEAHTGFEPVFEANAGGIGLRLEYAA